MKCSQAPSGHVQLADLGLMQQHRLQKAWQQAVVDQELAVHSCQGSPLHLPRVNSSHATTQPLILFIGVVSDSAASRQLARKSWFAGVNLQAGCQARFVVEEDQANLAEDEQHREDTIYVQQRSFLRRTLFLMQYALVHYDVQYIMKASDFTYINVQNLLNALQVNCTSMQCSHEHDYFGLEIWNTSVPLITGGNKPAANLQYYKTTHLKTFLPYMSGIGYAVSKDLAHVLIDTEHKTNSNDFLTELGDADMTLGFWLITLDTHRTNHPGVIACPQGICFKSQPGTFAKANNTASVSHILRPASGNSADFWNRQAVPKPITDVCSEDWLLMHPISQEHEVEYIQARLQQCKAADWVKDASMINAAKHRTVCQMHLPHGKVCLSLFLFA